MAILPIGGRSGDPLRQSAAIFGALLLCGPALFFLIKRAGYSKSPPFWFSLHVYAASVGIVLIIFHVSAGSLWSPAGVPFLVLVLLVVQGLAARALLATRLSTLFARSPGSFNFSNPISVDKAQLALVIEKKEQLLRQLDPSANEATFSPRLRHFLLKPWKAWSYQRLSDRETRLVGAKSRAGLMLSFWRRSHIVLAVLFYGGLIAHLIVVLFFAGYASKGGEIYWWHLTDWGQ
ncbi:MAG: hypothetical protein VX444_15425 [Pseudomonadota bacterium]|nr:hypothetical protein [Pseudomonadota bacterium]